MGRNINPDNYKFKPNFSNRRMKLYIKLNKAETEAWSNVKAMVAEAAGTNDDSTVAKILFFRGINGFMEDVHERVSKLSDEEKSKIMEDSDIDLDSSPTFEKEEETDDSTTD